MRRHSMQPPADYLTKRRRRMRRKIELVGSAAESLDELIGYKTSMVVR